MNERFSEVKIMNERKKVVRWWWVWDFEKEERWLNNMAADGWVLDGVGFCTYYFVPCRPGEYIIRQEMRDPDEEYARFMAEMGAEEVGRFMNWHYFRRKSELGAFDLYSDIDSRLGHLNRIARALRILGIANIVIGVGNTLALRNAIPLINLLCGCLVMYGLGRIDGKADELKNERDIHE